MQEPTRDKDIFDKIFLNSQSALLYLKPVNGPNFGKADHKSIILKPKTNLPFIPNTTLYVKLYDYRESFLTVFLLSWLRYRDTISIIWMLIDRQNVTSFTNGLKHT